MPVAFLFDHFVCPRQHVRRNREADLFSRFQIDDELELGWLFHRQVGWLGPFKDFVYVGILAMALESLNSRSKSS